MAIDWIEGFNAQMPFPLDLRSVKPNIEARNSMPTNSRYEGLTVYVINEQKKYVLKGGTDNSNWVEEVPGSTTPVVQNVTWNSIEPTTQGADGDIWFRPLTGSVELWYRSSGIWTKLGEWDTGSGSGSASWGNITGVIGDQTDLYAALNVKQDALVSGTSIKTINGTSILGGGDLAVKAIESIELTSTVGLVDTYTVTYSDASTYQFTVTNGSNAQSFNFLGNVNDYASLPSSGNVQNDAWYNLTDELLYVYNGTSFPPDGEGISFSGTTPTLQNVMDAGSAAVRTDTDDPLSIEYNRPGPGLPQYTKVYQDDTDLILSARDESEVEAGIRVTNEAGIADLVAFGCPLRYDADYSTSYSDRSLVDKGYVDVAVAGGGANASREYLLSGLTGSDKTIKTWTFDLFDIVLKVVSGTIVWTIVPTGSGPDGEYRVFEDVLGPTGVVTPSSIADTILNSTPVGISSAIDGIHKVTMYSRISMGDTLTADNSLLNIEATTYFADDAFASSEFWICVSMKYSFTPGP
ncbi:hypothetical protein G5B30_16530 [Sphingobacterium sp. SGG-5]|uniref:hypothetical protein n=1 Tax=Sphingobacterium sp. SGG-5 TaxID=2710881 RepID=UPI0013ED29DF|nr:hypothetical protein [Sphingobacterium sp. SGG-5]NGM63517.1 hypothetical protein [Sphingobacterium sp. SGG-5]